MKPEPDATNSAVNTSVATVRTYHQRTKHNFAAYAQGPDTLDWDAQPASFRHFENIPDIQLPNFSESLQDPDLFAALTRPFAVLCKTIQPLPYSLSTLGALLHLSLGITAWKSYGPDRWAVRANPSSGNLHPIEAYVLVQGLHGLPNGVYHYCPDSHALERRADIACEQDSIPMLQIGLSSAMWREAWKYGERAFRYCQLDTGHAIGALSYAAQALGWSLAEQKDITSDKLAHLLGVDRNADFPARRHPETEREEAEILLSVSFNSAATSISQQITPAFWQGTASTIDAHPIYRWPVIEEVALASRQTAARVNDTAVRPTSNIYVTEKNNQISTASVILGRRSAQRFNATHVMPAQDFINMLDALLPKASTPWNALSSPPSINILLFVHRVESFKSGLYLLTRVPRLAAQLDAKLSQPFLREPIANVPAHLNLQFLTPAPMGDLHRIARSMHCHQDIAANACFALGMLAEYDGVIADNPAAYRDMHREAGLIGQVLYLQAEMVGLRGTGIGCFFDDPIHELLGLSDETFQTIYHFTVGLALDDTRIENIPTSSLTIMQARIL
ncbi:MAG: SagB family peptide dehydrogenase [Methylotenera sp.]|nr:SagB family peptide dehydrogenase [Methylotenera sp.]